MKLSIIFHYIHSGNLKELAEALKLYLQMPNASLNQAQYFKIDKNTYYYLSSLMLAARSRQIEAMRLLLENGAHINYIEYYKESKNLKKVRGTALIFGVQSDSIEVVRFLLENGAKTNPHEYNPNTRTALVEAVKLGSKDIVTLLLKYNAKINVQAGSISPLSQSIMMWDIVPSENQLALTEVLIEKGASYTAGDFLKIFYDDFNQQRYSSSVYTQKRKLIYQLFKQQDRLLHSYCNRKKILLIEIITHNNKVNKLAQATGFALARQTIFPVSIVNLISEYAFLDEKCQQTLTYEFNRACQDKNSISYSENKDPIPTQCAIL